MDLFYRGYDSDARITSGAAHLSCGSCALCSFDCAQRAPASRCSVGRGAADTDSGCDVELVLGTGWLADCDHLEDWWDWRSMHSS